MKATLYLPGKPARLLTDNQVHDLNIGYAYKNGVVALPNRRVVAGNPRRIDRWLGLPLHPERQLAYCEPLATSQTYAAYVSPNAADENARPNPAGTAALNELAWDTFEGLVGPLLIITC